MEVINIIANGFRKKRDALLEEYQNPDGFRTNRETIELFKKYQRIADISEVLDEIEASIQSGL